MIFSFPLGIQSRFAMFSKAKMTQFIDSKFFALLELVMWPFFYLALSSLFAFLTFPTLETLQAIGMGNEKMSIVELKEEINNLITSVLQEIKFDGHWLKMPIGFLLANLSIILSAGLSKLTPCLIIGNKESIGPFLFGLRVILLAVSYFFKTIYF